MIYVAGRKKGEPDSASQRCRAGLDSGTCGQVAASHAIQGGGQTGGAIPLSRTKAGVRGQGASYVPAQLGMGQKSFDEPHGWSLVCGIVTLLAQLPFSIRRDIAQRKVLKYGWLLKGPVMVSPAEFNQTLPGDGIGIQTDEKTTKAVIP